jgi:hypothetical protein
MAPDYLDLPEWRDSDLLDLRLADLTDEVAPTSD